MIADLTADLPVWCLSVCDVLGSAEGNAGRSALLPKTFEVDVPSPDNFRRKYIFALGIYPSNGRW